MSVISGIKQAIVSKLSELYPASSGYTIYDEDMPQSFTKPSFLITLKDQNYSKRMNMKFKSLLSFDVAYFSDKEATGIKADCLDVKITLFRSFDIIGTYRVLNKHATITDNVLHLTFDINYSEINVKAETKMQQIQTNTNI